MALDNIDLHVNDVGMELRSHGTVQFPCASYRAALTSSPDSLVPWHWHEELEIIMVAEGTLTVQIPSQVFELSAGQMLFINSNVAHTVRGAASGLLRSIVFRASLLAGESASVFARHYINPLIQAGQIPAMLFGQDNGASTISAFEAAFDALQSEAFGFEFLVREKLTSIALAVLAENSEVLQAPRQTADIDSVRLDKMLRFIHSYFEQPLTLGEIAAAASIGERECLRCFKKTIGESPIQYLLRFRVEQSRSWLIHRTDLAVAEIAYAHGFESPSYFAQVFKRFFGMTPKQYRQKNLER